MLYNYVRYLPITRCERWTGNFAIVELGKSKCSWIESKYCSCCSSKPCLQFVLSGRTSIWSYLFVLHLLSPSSAVALFFQQLYTTNRTSVPVQKKVSQIIPHQTMENIGLLLPLLLASAPWQRAEQHGPSETTCSGMAFYHCTRITTNHFWNISFWNEKELPGLEAFLYSSTDGCPDYPQDLSSGCCLDWKKLM